MYLSDCICLIVFITPRYATTWQGIQSTAATASAAAAGTPTAAAAAGAGAGAATPPAKAAAAGDPARAAVALQRYAAEPGQRSFYNTWWLKRNTLNPEAYREHKVTQKIETSSICVYLVSCT